MDISVKYMLLLALVSFIIFMVFAIVSLTKSVKTMQSISDNVDKMSKDLVNAINNITVDIDEIKVELFKSMENIKETSTQFKNTAKVIETGTQSVNRTISLYTGLLDSFYTRIYVPVSKTGHYISAVTKAVSTFAGYLANRKKNLKQP